jgi:general secretion pathway protein G
MHLFDSDEAKGGGFTLIELLVVMTIIGLMLGFSFVAFQSSRAQARDTKRKADLQQIASALEAYRSDSDWYPPNYTISSGLSCSPAGIPTINYIGAMTDPLGSNYTYSGAGTSGTNSYCLVSGNPITGYPQYHLCAQLESPGSDPHPDCTSPYNYEVSNP